jgi:hypothetical protein
MPIFQLSREDAKKFETFAAEVRTLAENLGTYKEDSAVRELVKLADGFEKKTREFFNTERRLYIGIVGQVKAGKSSFLNTLLFGGRSVLPKASTPKTATLTKMEYAGENVMEIEYYSADDWDNILSTAAMNLEGVEYESARELAAMALANGVDTDKLTARGKEPVPFDSYDALQGRLNDYVGENGRYTPLVKAVTLRVDNPLFQELSIVDTPGLNDPVFSRTERTKEFMEVCDVVFFLSPCSSFLDKSDWVLLSSQLPQKGVKRLILVGSKFDSGLRDVLRHNDPDDPFGMDPNSAENIADAMALVKKKLTNRAREKVAEYGRDLAARELPQNMLNVIESCKTPLFASSICQNMAGRAPEELDQEEMNIYRALDEFSRDIRSDLPAIGGFADVETVRDEVVAEKEKILEEKSASFLPTARAELNDLLSSEKRKAEKTLSKLTGSARQDLIAEKDAMNRRMNGVRADVKTLIGEWLIKVEHEKINGIQALRTAARESGKLEERTGTEKKEGSYRVSDSVWYNPFSWGSSHREYYTYDVAYSYLVASDAADNIRNFILDGESRIEKVFTDAISHQELKRRILDIVADNFDMGDENYDASLVRLMVEEQINRIEFPVIKLDCSKDIDSITARFSGQIREGGDQNALRDALAKAVESAYSAMASRFDQAVREFKNTLSDICDTLSDNLLRDIRAKYDELIKQLDDKDINIERLKNFMAALDNATREM